MRENTFIRRKAADNIFRAFDYADDIGKALNLFVVIHLKDTPQQASDTAFKRICHKYREWLRYRRKTYNEDCTPTFVYTHENPNNNPHVNWCLHIPETLISDFELALPKWIEKTQGDLDEFTLNIDYIEPSALKAPANYILKGIDPESVQNYFGAYDHYLKAGEQGTIFGQRAGTSISLGKTARRRNGFCKHKYRQSKKYMNRSVQ